VIVDVTVIGGGLAGSEAAWQAAKIGKKVNLYEMRPMKETGAHRTGFLAELVCSNSLGSSSIEKASGLLKHELKRMGSMVLDCAVNCAVPAGGALAVDRDQFAQLVTEKLSTHPNIRILREELVTIPGKPTIVATGPLTSKGLSEAIERLTGREHLFFYDAVAPIVAADTINLDIAYRASRYEQGNLANGDYINCPLNQEQYETFVQALVHGERIEIKNFENKILTGVNAGSQTFFEGCLPIEILAKRDIQALAFGPMRPVGLADPRTGKQPYAVVQLRQDNLIGSFYNMVGFQTNLMFYEQERIFRMVPGLEKVEFNRFGQMHRNTYIYSPQHLFPSLQFRGRPDLFFAGQLTGVEGYLGNIATGLLAGLNIVRYLKGHNPISLPVTTMIGALCHYITSASEVDFQPMKANFGLLPQLENAQKKGRKERYRLYGSRAMKDLNDFLSISALVEQNHAI
jgi:methylenetetrahydrofolate--tRNA-(uracil-5-)-methyltransferase